jgi:hypothetical protein
MSPSPLYLEAKFKIERAIRAGARKLNLSNFGLEELPDSLT